MQLCVRFTRRYLKIIQKINKTFIIIIIKKIVQTYKYKFINSPCHSCVLL